LTERSPSSTWLPVAALFVAWLGHVSLSYTAAGLRCHDVVLTGEVLDVDAWKLAMLAVTLGAATLLALALAMFVRRRRAAGEAGEDGDRELSAFMGTVLGALFAAYLVWSVVQTLTGTAVC
jgi:hypothetical protein